MNSDKQDNSMEDEDHSDVDLNAKETAAHDATNTKSPTDLNASVLDASVANELTPELLDDIIERLVYHDKYPGYTINENKQTSQSNLPYILKEKEIRLLIGAAENVFRDQPILLELVPPINILGDIHG